MKINKSTVLTVLGGIGVIATVALAIRATPKAIARIEDRAEEICNELEDGDYGEYMGDLEVVKACWDCYIPTFLMGTATIACIFGANALNRKQQAMVASAYALVNEAGKEYRKKVKELYGNETDTRVCEEIAKDRYHQDDIKFEEGDKYLFYDTLGFGYFESAVRRTVLDDGLECFILDIEPAGT